MNILILGASDIGYHLTKRLSDEKHNITIIEKDPSSAHRAGELLDAHIIVGSGSSFEVLKKAKIDQTDCLVAISNVDEINLLACRYAQKMNVPCKIARIRNPEFIKPDFVLSKEELGIDLLVHPEKETADAIGRLIKQSSATDIVEFSGGKIQLVGIRLEENSPLSHKTLYDIWGGNKNLPARVVAIKRKENTIIPRGNDIFVPRDQVFIVCDKNLLPEIVQITGKENVSIQNIMILGGGLIGQYVARELEEDADIKIIESQTDKSKEIANILMKTLVIHGDGTDMDLLASAGISDMDSFIAVTGDDETNIISALLARHLQIPQTIALVNKTEFMPIAFTIGMDAVVSKKLITVNSITSFIHRGIRESIASIPGLDAEIIEIVAQSGSKITKKSLKHIHYPHAAIVGAVKRGENIIVPTGDTLINEGDRAVIVVRPKAYVEVEKLFKK